MTKGAMTYSLLQTLYVVDSGTELLLAPFLHVGSRPLVGTLCGQGTGGLVARLVVVVAGTRFAATQTVHLWCVCHC